MGISRDRYVTAALFIRFLMACGIVVASFSHYWWVTIALIMASVVGSVTDAFTPKRRHDPQLVKISLIGDVLLALSSVVWLFWSFRPWALALTALVVYLFIVEFLYYNWADLGGGRLGKFVGWHDRHRSGLYAAVIMLMTAAGMVHYATMVVPANWQTPLVVGATVVALLGTISASIVNFEFEAQRGNLRQVGFR